MEYCIIFIITLINFAFDYLSDSEITQNELKIGILQFIHHFILSIHVGMFFLPKNIFIVILCTLVNIIVQIGWLVFSERCWLSDYINKVIGTKNKNRKWMADPESHIKHYLYGTDWSTSEFDDKNNKYSVILFNLLNLGILYQFC
jgi:hypothetical protein